MHIQHFHVAVTGFISLRTSLWLALSRHICELFTDWLNLRPERALAMVALLAMVYVFVFAIADQCDGHKHVVLKRTPNGKRVRPQSEVPNGTRFVVLG